jgi:hypothetical protein
LSVQASAQMKRASLVTILPIIAIILKLIATINNWQ